MEEYAVEIVMGLHFFLYTTPIAILLWLEKVVHKFLQKRTPTVPEKVFDGQVETLEGDVQYKEISANTPALSGKSLYNIDLRILKTAFLPAVWTSVAMAVCYSFYTKVVLGLNYEDFSDKVFTEYYSPLFPITLIVLYPIGPILGAFITDRYYLRRIDWAILRGTYLLPHYFIIFFLLSWTYSAQTIAVGLLPIFVFYLAWLYYHRRLLTEVKSYPYETLLVLRLFNKPRTTRSAFNNILRFWQYRGPFIILSDITLFHYQDRDDYGVINWQKKIKTGLRKWLYLIGFFAIPLYYGLQPADSHKQFDFAEYLTIIGCYVLLVFVLSKIVNRGTFSTVINSTRQIVQNGDMQKPKRGWFTLAFNGLSIYSQHNDWKEALEWAASQADKVIMDLRGFSQKNEGCRFEIEYLIDHFPLQQVLFWFDHKSDMAYFKELVKSKSRHIYSRSPNAKVIIIRFFIGSMRKRKHAKYILNGLLVADSH